jgi:hypothetical protein
LNKFSQKQGYAFSWSESKDSDRREDGDKQSSDHWNGASWDEALNALEGDLEVGESNTAWIVLLKAYETSGSVLLLSRGRVFYSGNNKPKVSGFAIAAVPLWGRDSSNIDVISGSLANIVVLGSWIRRRGAPPVRCPVFSGSISLIFCTHTVVSSPCNVKVTAEWLIVNAEKSLRVAALRNNAIWARSIDGKAFDLLWSREWVGITKINLIRSAMVFEILVEPRSAWAYDGIDLVHTIRASVARVGSIAALDVPFILSLGAVPRSNSLWSLSVSPKAVVITSTNAVGTLQVSCVLNGGIGVFFVIRVSSRNSCDTSDDQTQGYELCHSLLFWRYRYLLYYKSKIYSLLLREL